MSAAPAPTGHASLVARLTRLASLARTEDRTGLHHAYVFAGPSGVGKFTTALWWASRLKCASDERCPGCSHCQQVAAGSHRDVHVLTPEKEGARIKIEQTRGLLDSMAKRPSSQGPNIALVREADQLTVDAQNSLLKLLEEPPGFAILVLVADNPAALLPTIRSRCQVLRFGPLADEELRNILRAKGLAPKDLARVASAGRGSVGRALALDAEALDALDELLLAFEASGEPDGDIDALVDRLVARKSEGFAMEELLAWATLKVRRSLGIQTKSPASQELKEALDKTSHAESAQLVAIGQRILQTASALERNANAKIAIRDLLLHVRG